MNECFFAATENGLVTQEILAYGLFFLGLVFVITEIFIPGFIMGLLGLASMIAGVILAFGVSTRTGGILTIGGFAAIVGFLIAWVKMIGPALAHRGNVKDDEVARETQHSLLNQEGVAVTTLRPAGTARVGNKRIDVVTDGEIIDADTRIKVVEIRGNQVIVRAVRM